MCLQFVFPFSHNHSICSSEHKPVASKLNCDSVSNYRQNFGANLFRPAPLPPPTPTAHLKFLHRFVEEQRGQQTSLSLHLRGLRYSQTFHVNLQVHEPSLPHPHSSVTIPSLGFRFYDFRLLSFSLLSTYNPLLYKVFKILFVLYDVSMVTFFIKEEENLFLLLVCFIILFLNWYCKISMQELLSGAFLFKNVICVINGRIC